ncbi:MAG: MFS transporter [Hyphomicrobiaceae bacterium]
MTTQGINPTRTGAGIVAPDSGRQRVNLVDSRYAWCRLLVCLLLSTLGAAGLWTGVVALPKIQEDFGVDRAAVSLSYTACMVGFGLGGVVIGRLLDRLGALVPIMLSAVCVGGGFYLAAQSTTIWELTAANGLLIGVGASATFGPLMADVSQWFAKRRGTAIAICASGNYLAGVLWPMVMQQLLTIGDWRQAYMIIGLSCAGLMLPLSLFLIKRAPSEAEQEAAATADGGEPRRYRSPLPAWGVQSILVLAGLACCVAMSMPQVHIVAYCVDLNFGVSRGAEMLSLMLGMGVISRLASGVIADRIGGVRTLLLGTYLQCLTLILYVPFDGLVSLYVVSALFGLAQGGIVPSYAVVVREYFPAREAGMRISLCLMATILGMALGGWLSGLIFDITGSYRAAFVHGVAWNMLNIALVLLLMWRVKRVRRRRRPMGAMAAA